MAGLTTHVLDLAGGKPAAGVAVRLLGKTADAVTQLGAFVTDADGRARLAAAPEVGGYRLEFDIGAYFRASGASSAEPGFLETVVIDFTLTDPAMHHHVPLLVSPFGYSTYRGS